MSAATRYRQLPSSGRSIGFELQMPGDLDVQPVDGDVVVRCRERRDDGKTVGELEVAVFRAALVIDRDGILEDKVSTIADGVADQGARVLPAIPVELPSGATGYRADVELTRRPLPYVYVFAIAPHDGVDSGLLVTIRSAAPEWAAADAILKSLRILGRRGVTANDAHDAPAMPLPPILGKRG